MKATITGVKKHDFPNKEGGRVKGFELHLQFKTAEVIGTACEVTSVTNSKPDMFRPYLAKKNIRYLTPHKLRHTFATFLLRSGTDTETARAILGHSDISTTQIYVHTDEDTIRKALDSLDFT